MATPMPIQLKNPIQIPQVPCGSIKEFIPHLNKHQDTSVATILEPFKSFESELRKVYAQQPDHEIIKDGHINMVPIFDGHEGSLKIRARNLKQETDEEKSKYIMTFSEGNRKQSGEPAIVEDFKEFQKNFNLFSESSLIDLDWNNVVVAGSAVTTALLPTPKKWAANKKTLREYYHEHLAPASDVDIFLYGLNEEQAFEKIKQIEQSIKNSILHEVTTIRTKNAITIASQYPTRHVQIVLRLYKSISEIITGFDVDCACAAYDGKQVYAAPRAIGAFITQCNTIDLTRRSPSYENRLSKYSHRGFEVHWPLLDRTRIDPTIFERSFGRTQGLARLLILEKLPKAADRDRYQDQRRAERGRPQVIRPYRNLHSANIKEREEDEVADWAESEDVASYHTMTVPYGPKYHAAKINRLLYAKDLLLNAEWNLPKDRDVHLHRHPCFFGTAAEVLEDCCGYCPVPKTDEEIEVAEEENKTYISGKLKFIVDDPGRQAIGSFNPITDDEWTTMAYVGDTARLCQAIVDGDLEHVQDWCSAEGVDVNRRDYTGRTPLHLATMASTPEVVKCLVDHGARLVARLVDGRTALHIAAARGNAEMVKTLMNKSLENEEEEEERKEARRIARRTTAAATGKNEDRDGEEDDIGDDDSGSEPSELTLESEDEEDRMTMGSFVKVDGETQTQENTVLDDSTEEPDFYDVDVIAWDYGFSPLHLAILNGHTHIIELLASEYGADVMLPVKLVERGTSNAKGAIMTIVLAMTLPKNKAIEAVKMLVQLGANCAQADMDHYTAFHYAVMENNSDVLDALLAEDRPLALSVLNNVAYRKHDNQTWTPLASAVQRGHEEMVPKLLAMGAKPTLTFDDWVKTYLARNTWAKNQSNDQVQAQYRAHVTQPIMAAADKLLTKSVLALLAHGADPQTLNSVALNILQNPTLSLYQTGESLLDIVNKKIKALQDFHSSNSIPRKPEELRSQSSYLHGLEPGTYQYWSAVCDYEAKKKQNDEYWADWSEESKTVTPGLVEKKAAILEMIQSLESVKDALILAGAKTFHEQHPNLVIKDQVSRPPITHEPAPYATSLKFALPDLNEIKNDGYIGLFNAAWHNDSETVEKLTLSPWTWKSNSTLEPPLKIAVRDHNGFSPFSIALLRGHRELAKKIIQICMTQYHKDDGLSTRQRWAMRTGDSDDDDSDDDDNVLPIFSELVNDKFTIDNLGDVATLVKSDVLPSTMIEWKCCTERFGHPSKTTDAVNGLENQFSLIEYAVETDNKELLRFLLEVLNEQQARLTEEDGDQECYRINQFVFWKAIRLGRTEMLADMIKTTGVGISLNQLVKRSGAEVIKKPKYYQGLSVGGKKRADWAQAPGHNIREVEEEIPPLLTAAQFGSIDSVEWFMSDAPLRRYKEFAESKKNDKRIKTLKEAGKPLESIIGAWLTLKNNLTLHSAILYIPKKNEDTRQHLQLIKYLISLAPENIEQKTSNGWTPLHLAVSAHRPDIVSTLISAGANPMARDGNQRNIIHLMLTRCHHNVIETNAKRLETMLQLFNKDHLKTLLTERCDYPPSALTPLALWMSVNNGSYKKSDIIEVLAKYSTGEELEMINGEGDLPVHVAIKQALSTITQCLISLNPSVLYRENSTGRTPLEMSRDIYLASCVEKYDNEQSQWVNFGNSNNITLLNKPAREFIKSLNPPPVESKKRTWEICADVDAATGSDKKKRRLVSLFEANEVAKRVGGMPRSRWGGNSVAVFPNSTTDNKTDVVGSWLLQTLVEVQGHSSKLFQ